MKETLVEVIKIGKAISFPSYPPPPSLHGFKGQVNNITNVIELFNFIISDEIKNHLLMKTNERRNQRYQFRNNQNNPNNRGHIQTTSTKNIPNNY